MFFWLVMREYKQGRCVKSLSSLVKFKRCFTVATPLKRMSKINEELICAFEPVLKIILSRLLSFFWTQLLRFRQLVPFGVIQQHTFLFYVGEEVSPP